MDSKLRTAERAWRKQHSDETALEYLRELTREGDLLFQLMRRMAQVELRAARTIESGAVPTWSQVVAWWLGDSRVADEQAEERQDPPRREAPRLSFNYAINRGYSYDWLAAVCACGHHRGHHGGQPESRHGCFFCGCQRYEGERFEACTIAGRCGEVPEPGYPACRRHVQALFPGARHYV